ncbi:rod shape-determining protein MreC [Massilia sp. CF038]|uniref:rod shape-determining protein MreC n=1 Tax=Massilia sp. CF038 TaxID=1881045 RepID=UPI0035A2E273
MTVFAFISILLLLVDSRFHTLSTVRQVTGTVLYPLQMAALMPRDALNSVSSYFSSIAALQRQVHDLQESQVASAQTLQQARMQMAENVQLRKLLGARLAVPVPTLMSEILYDARDSSTRKIVLDRGLREGVKLGLPVIDSAGVVGQVTRVFPFTSEVTLLTDKEQAIPVQVLRNGLRSVAYGRGQSGLLDLRFVAPNADIVVGDVLITSGLDGVYPAGLAVAKVVRVENSASGPFGSVVCQPLAGIDRHRQLLMLMATPDVPPRPPEEDAKPIKKSQLPKMVPIREGAPAAPLSAAAAGAAPATIMPAAPTASAPAAAAPAQRSATRSAPRNVPPVTPAPNPAATPAIPPVQPPNPEGAR